MSDLVDFLTRRLAEDEAVARAAIDPERPGTHWRWFHGDDDTEWTHPPDEEDDRFRLYLGTVETFPTQSVGPLPAFPIPYVEADGWTGALPHVARHDPARVLREVAAKRAILALHEGYEKHDGGYWCGQCADGGYGDKADWPCPTLRALAAPFCDHPDFQEQWR